MTIRVTLGRVLADRNVSLTELGDRVGITLANLSILKTGKARAVRFTTLDALCRVLDCQPADLLVFEPDECDSVSAGPDRAHPSETTGGEDEANGESRE